MNTEIDYTQILEEGDKVQLRDGSIETVMEIDITNSEYPIRLVNGFYYKSCGSLWLYRDDCRDIVRIVKSEDETETKPALPAFNESLFESIYLTILRNWSGPWQPQHTAELALEFYKSYNDVLQTVKSQPDTGNKES